MKEQNQTKSTNIKWHNLTIDREKLEKMRGHKGMVIWFTGLSGSGKSTLANALNEVLHLDGFSTYVLDGDNIRHGLCKDLGFSDEDREENIRRIGEVANLFMNAGIITITAFVSPFISDRDKVRKIIGSKDFIEDNKAEIKEKFKNLCIDPELQKTLSGGLQNKTSIIKRRELWDQKLSEIDG